MPPLSAKISFNWRELTPVSVIDGPVRVVGQHDAAVQEREGIVDAAKASAQPFKMGGTGSKREDHVLVSWKEDRREFAYLPYKSGGEAATQLVGNHTASNVNNPSENLGLARSCAALCVFDKGDLVPRPK
jgi:tripartite-type tricarboxylate transporter receptor subunit TctC